MELIKLQSKLSPSEVRRVMLSSFRNLAIEYSDYLNEVSLTLTNDYKKLNKKYIKSVEHIFNGRQYIDMCVFEIQGTMYYSVLILRGLYIEPHFGVFNEGKFNELEDAIKVSDKLKIQSLMRSPDFVQKDGYTNLNIPFIKILSYVFSFLNEYISKKEIGFIRIMGNPAKYNIYKKLVRANVKHIPYNIIQEDEETSYTDKTGETIEAKCTILKYKFA